MPDWIHAEENRVSLGDDRRFALWTELELETAKVSQSKSIHTLRRCFKSFFGRCWTINGSLTIPTKDRA